MLSSSGPNMFLASGIVCHNPWGQGVGAEREGVPGWPKQKYITQPSFGFLGNTLSAVSLKQTKNTDFSPKCNGEIEEKPILSPKICTCLEDRGGGVI